MILIVQLYSYLCIMAASLTFLIEIFLQRWRVAPLSLQLLYRYDVRGNPDEMCVSACSVLDWCNPVLLTLLISLLTLSFNTSAAIFLPFSPLSQHYCTVCTKWISMSTIYIGLPRVSPKRLFEPTAQISRHVWRNMVHYWANFRNLIQDRKIHQCHALF